MQNTPQQQAVIDRVRDTKDNLRVDAVAGSGKTTTLVAAAQGIPSRYNVLALAFNKIIADELQSKFPSHVTAMTMNSVGHRVWAKKKGRMKLDSRKMGRLVTDYLNSAGLNTDDADPNLWGDIRNITTAVKSLGFIPPNAMDLTQFPATELTYDIIESIAETFDISLKPTTANDIINGVSTVITNSIREAFESCIDFDDQVYMSTYFAEDKFWPKNEVILVDEAQDLSKMQHDMVERLGNKARVIAVGDKHQAIYGWRGASCNSMEELQERFNLQPMPLTVSFRCPSNIVAKAKAIVPHIEANRQGGTVEYWQREWDERAGKPVNQWNVYSFEKGSVVLCRNNAPLIKLGFAFLKAGIPTFFTARDLGNGLKKIVKGLKGDDLATAIDQWYDKEYATLKEKKKLSSIDILNDKYQALHAVREGCNAITPRDLTNGIDELFLRKADRRAIELSSIHRAKGKEWDTVYFMNENLIPGRWIMEAAESGVPGSADLLQQEENLRYVAITRALSKLVYFELTKKEPVRPFVEDEDNYTLTHDELTAKYE